MGENIGDCGRTIHLGEKDNSEEQVKLRKN